MLAGGPVLAHNSRTEAAVRLALPTEVSESSTDEPGSPELAAYRPVQRRYAVMLFPSGDVPFPPEEPPIGEKFNTCQPLSNGHLIESSYLQLVAAIG